MLCVCVCLCCCGSLPVVLKGWGESALSAGEGAVVRVACVQSGVVSVCASVNKTLHVRSAPFGQIQGSC